MILQGNSMFATCFFAKPEITDPIFLQRPKATPLYVTTLSKQHVFYVLLVLYKCIRVVIQIVK